MEQMERIRDQQENLAKLHFELGAKQDVSTPLTQDGLRSANDNMDKLMERLEVKRKKKYIHIEVIDAY